MSDQTKTKLQEGDEAPDFALKDASGKTHRLSDYRGQKVIVYFYPADDTPGCTKEACDFRDNLEEFDAAGYTILGISPQDPDSKQRFTDKYGLNFPLLADEGSHIADAYGTHGMREIFGNQILTTKRSTFIIDEDGKIVRAMYGVHAKNHVDDLREKLGV